MDLQTAENIIATEIKQHQSEIDSLNLALSVLQSTFQPDLTSLDNVKISLADHINKVKELNQQVDQLNVEKTTLEDTNTTLQNQVGDLTTQVNDQVTSISDLQKQLQPTTNQGIVDITSVNKIPEPLVGV